MAKRKTVTFLISDFLGERYEQAMRIVSRKHDLVPVTIADPYELTFPSLGLVDLEDPETGQRVTVDTRNPRIRGRFTQAMETRRTERTRFFAKLKLDFVELKAGEEHALALQRFFRRRSRRLAG